MADQKYCRNCGAPTIPDALFCANCGTAFAGAAAPPPRTTAPSNPSTRQPPHIPSPQPKRRLNRRHIVYGVVILIGLLAIVNGLSDIHAGLQSVQSPVSAKPAQNATQGPIVPSATPTITPTSASSLAAFESYLQGATP